MSEEFIRETLELLREDRARGLHFVPVRHHSPACALHVERLISSVEPDEVLIEGPEDLTPLIPMMLHPDVVAPIAAYCTFVDQSRREGPFGSPARHGAYYPFCDYSPELVALRSGRKAKSRLAFIDLTYGEKVLVSETENASKRRLVESLLEESYHAESRYLDVIAKRMGCRDHDELWDHLFETRTDVDTSRFIDEVAAYCAAARAEHDERVIRLEGNVARERNMAHHIAGAIDRGAQRIVVVTGGFHTAALPRLVREKPERAERPELEGATTVLMRYSFDQLDALNGYSAGMPAPAYYDRVFARRGASDALFRAAAEVLVDLSRATAKRRARTISTAQVIDALAQASRLAELRGRAGPSRDDLLDAVTSCFVKGSMDAEGVAVMADVRRALAGDRVGIVPKEAGSPPIVDDFHRLATELSLDVSDVVKKELTLELYKKVGHRRTSRYLHALLFLDVPFGTVIAGPDFALGVDLERLQEIWTYAWTPSVESALIERMAYGATIAEAVSAVLEEQLVRAREGRSTRAAVELLVKACRMGLFESPPRSLNRIMAVAATAAAEDPSFPSLVFALSQLVLLAESREPLEAFRLSELPELIRLVYERSCFALDRSTPKDHERETLVGFGTLRNLVSRSARGLEGELYYDALVRVLRASGAIGGAAAGYLFLDGRLTEEALMEHVIGHLGGAGSSPEEKTGFLRGLLVSAREVAWRVGGIVQAIANLLDGWDDEEFQKALPELRLAFADLTPKETDRVAALVARHAGGELGELFALDVTEEEAVSNASMTARARTILERDHLGAWA